MDIVIPNNNEEEFILMASRLGYNALCFLNSFDDYLANAGKFEAAGKKIKICRGIIANIKDVDKIHAKLGGKKAFIAIKSSGNDRELIEKSRANLIFSIEEDPRKDFMHQRAAGLNHILCKLAKEHKVIIGFSLGSILNSGSKHIIMGRMMQNLKICKKFNVRTIIASFAQTPYEMRAPHDLCALFGVLGSKMDFLKEQNLV